VRVERIRCSSSWACANSGADLNFSSFGSSPISAWAIAQALADVTGSNRNGDDRPCRYALRLDVSLPAAVFGPVLFWGIGAVGRDLLFSGHKDSA
jgi:hypothetical protein